MEERLEELRARIEELTRQLSDLRNRVSAIEKGRPALPEEAGAASRDQSDGARVGTAAAPEPLAAGVVRTSTLVGRTLVVLGGAYLLRAITDAAVIPKAGGVLAGLAYAALWLARADREATAGRRPSAAFHGLAAAMIAFPLIAETTARFGVLPAPAGAAALVAFMSLALAVALRRDLPAVGSITVLFAVGTALVLLVTTRDLMAYTLALLASAASVEALAFEDRWLGLRWPTAIALDLGILAMAEVMARPGGVPEGYAPVSPPAAVAVQVLLPLLYAGSIAARTLLRQRPLTPFEGTQLPFALLVGLSGAARVSVATGVASLAGPVSLLLGAVGYAAAFAVLEPRERRDAAFHFHATTGCVLLLAGASLVLSGPALVVALLWLALAGLGVGAWSRRRVMAWHGAAYLAAAAFAAGLVGSASDALLASATGSWRPLTAAAGAVLAATTVGYGILLTGPNQPRPAWWQRLPRVVVAVLLGSGVAGAVVRGLVQWLAAGPGPVADAAVVATARSAILAALAVALAWAGRRWELAELTWLVYPLLGGGGIKLLIEDLPHGRPTTLFMSLTLYGGALLAAPRLLRRESS